MKKLSRSKLELFLDCPRCFWLDVRQGIKRPRPAPYTINNAVDYLLKQEFDAYREKGTRHPIMEKHGIRAIPYQNEKIDTWRHNFTGVQHYHEPTDFLVFGAVDDVWIDPEGNLIVVDYKATGANQHRVYDSYRRQIEIYQWLLRRNNFLVSPSGYFVFARVNKGNGFGNGKGTLPFDIFIEEYKGDDSWIEDALAGAKAVYESDSTPSTSQECGYCSYREAARGASTT